MAVMLRAYTVKNFAFTGERLYIHGSVLFSWLGTSWDTSFDCTVSRAFFCFLTAKGVSFQLNLPCQVGEIISDDVIRLGGGWLALTSYEKQISF